MTRQFFFVVLMGFNGPGLQTGTPGLGLGPTDIAVALDGTFSRADLEVGWQVTTTFQPEPTFEQVVPAGQQVPSGVPQSTAPGNGQQPQPVAE